jgi:hypothetical protein
MEKQPETKSLTKCVSKVDILWLYLEEGVQEVVELRTTEDQQAEDVAEDTHGGHQGTQDTVEHRPHLYVASIRRFFSEAKRTISVPNLGL